MRFLLKTLGVVAIATAVVLVWHLGTTMPPLAQDLEIQACALSARVELEKRDTESDFPIKVHWGLAERLFRDVRATAHVSIDGGPDALIFCHTRAGESLALMVDGKWLREYD